MARLKISRMSLPADLAGKENGNLPDKMLVDIKGGKLHHLAANAWKAMLAQATKDKIELAPTSAADAYRPLSVQERGFLARYDNTKRLTTKPRVYEGKMYWLKPGNAPMAVPGTSNHGWGLAVDVASITQAKVEWLLKNAAKYGFSWEMQNEPWHIRYVAGDKVPQAVAEFVASKPAAAPKPTAPVKKTAKKAAAKKTAKKAVKKATS